MLRRGDDRSVSFAANKFWSPPRVQLIWRSGLFFSLPLSGSYRNCPRVSVPPVVDTGGVMQSKREEEEARVRAMYNLLFIIILCSRYIINQHRGRCIIEDHIPAHRLGHCNKMPLSMICRQSTQIHASHTPIRTKQMNGRKWGWTDQ